MFDNLAEKLQTAFAKLRGNQKLTEADIDEAMRIVRSALLEADVNFRVVKSFINRVKEQALGAEVLDGLQPGQQVIKFVHDELVRTLSGIGPDESIDGAVAVPLNIQSRAMTVMMLCGLQGAGKTTLAGKLAKRLIGQGKQVLLAACDIQRPAAIQQLQVVGGQVGATVYTQAGMGPVDVAKNAVAFATEKRLDIVILDTAGRLHVDGSLMDELKAIHAATSPHETLLVVDAMTGQ
ncbi:MAG: signal recognition particle receptor subunit alpha, partial [Armatimonadota bacterium]